MGNNFGNPEAPAPALTESEPDECNLNLLKMVTNRNIKSASTIPKQDFDIDEIINGSTTPLHIAVLGGDETMVRELLEGGDDPNEKEIDYYNGNPTPLNLAAKCKNEKIVRMLISAGADIEAKDDEFGYSPLQVAAIYGRPKILKILVEAGADLSTRDNMNTPVMQHLHKGDVESAKILIEAGCDVNTKDEHGRTATLRALQENDVPMIKFLLAHGASLNLTDRHGCTVLDNTLKSINLDTVKTLIDCGIKVNEILKTTDYRRSKLQYAAEMNDVPMIEFLQSLGASIKVKKGSSTLLHYAAAENEAASNFEVIKMLLNKGLDINAPDESGKTPIHHLIEKANVEMIKFFLTNKADPNIRCKKGRNLIFHAVLSRNTDVVQFLIDNGSDINEVNNATNRLTLLHEVCASHYKHITMIEHLLKNGANINALDSQGRTPLMWFIKFPCGKDSLSTQISAGDLRYLVKLLRFLLEYSNVNIVTPAGLNILNICKDESLSCVIIEHLAKMEFLGIPVHPTILENVSDNDKFKDHFQKCTEELSVAKATKFEKSWVSFFNLLVDSERKLKNYAGNELIENDYIENDYKNGVWHKQFPIYGALMSKNMRKGLKKREAYDISMELLSDCLPIMNPTHLIIRDVLDCLSREDLSKFIYEQDSL